MLLRLRRFVAVAETPRGYWVVKAWDANYYAHSDKSRQKRMRRFVLKDSRKRYCYPTRAQAMESYLQRKRRHIQNLEFTLEVARLAQSVAMRLSESPEKVEQCASDRDIRCGHTDGTRRIVWE